MTQMSLPRVVQNNLASSNVGMSVSKTSSPWYCENQMVRLAFQNRSIKTMWHLGQEPSLVLNGTPNPQGKVFEYPTKFNV